MTTLKSLSKILLSLSLSFVTFGAVGTAAAAPAGQQARKQVKAAPSAVRANRPVQAQRGTRPNRALALNRPMVVAQAETTPVKARKFDRKERHAERIAKFDTNKNGQIDAPERLAMQKQRFAKLDANGDKAITMAEMQAAKEAHRKLRAEKGAMHPGKMGKDGKEHMGRKGKGQGKRGEARFAKLDSNGNGSVSWQEFSAAKQRDYGKQGGKGPRGAAEGKRRGRF